MKKIIGWIILLFLFFGLTIVLPAFVYGLKTSLIIYGIATVITVLFKIAEHLISDKK